MTKTIEQHEGRKYLRAITSPVDGSVIDIDVYAVLVAFDVTCPARQQAIKKLLCCGNRRKGDQMDDLIGAEAAVSRAIELQKVADLKLQREIEEEKLHPNEEFPEDSDYCGKISD